MNFIQLQNLVAYWADDLQFGYFTPTQVQRFLNNAQQEMQKRLVLAGQNFYVSCPVETTMVIGQADYVLPLDFLKVHRLETVDVQGNVIKLDPITLNQQDFLPRDNSQPSGYYLKRNKITLVPPPDSTDTLRLYYSYRVVDMINDTDVPDAPEEFHQYLAAMATFDCFLKDGRTPEVVVKKMNDLETALKQMANERRVDKPRQIVMTGIDNYGDAW
jgi:hypothetical protein